MQTQNGQARKGGAKGKGEKGGRGKEMEKVKERENVVEEQVKSVNSEKQRQSETGQGWSPLWRAPRRATTRSISGERRRLQKKKQQKGKK